MSDKPDGGRIEVLSEGPPTVYLIKAPIQFFSIGVITSKCAENNLSKAVS
jgi:hypothetical protein